MANCVFDMQQVSEDAVIFACLAVPRPLCLSLSCNEGGRGEVRAAGEGKRRGCRRFCNSRDAWVRVPGM
jgi:hypothetical protein